MYLHFEKTGNARSDCSILSLTWMGKVPDELPEDEAWKLNRTNYYEEGWLATANVRGIVGVTFTTSHCRRNIDYPPRANYNLRGHRSEVILVKWNEPYQKLASCDSSGVIFVWIKYEGRWSIELINDRNTAVTHFSWSHDGRMALICYQDGFVLVGSVAGQRYWSSMLNLEATITCGIWTPDDQQVYFGTTSGQIIVMDVHGAMVSQVQLNPEFGILSMAWSCEKFKMDETDDNPLDGNVIGNVQQATMPDRKFVLAVCLRNGIIYLLKTFDDVSPVQIDTKLQGNICLEWSNSRELLAVAGSNVVSKTNGSLSEYNNTLKFYNDKGALLHTVIIPYTQAAVSAMTWGHNDKRLFLATGTQLHIAWVSRRVAALQQLCRMSIRNTLEHEDQLQRLPLPPKIRNIIGSLYASTIRCCVPESCNLREFVSRPPIGSVRLHCTMMRHDEEMSLTSGTSYTLYLEYLGGLVPLLKGKRTSKLRPEFVIFDPQLEGCAAEPYQLRESRNFNFVAYTNSNGLGSDSSESDHDDGCTGSPRMRRRRRKNKSQTKMHLDTQRYSDVEISGDLGYIDNLPEQAKLVEVTSNIWGTKFKIHGVAESVPDNLGQVTYKTSLLHLQPRQMTLVITELRDDFPVEPDPNFNPNIFSEDEDFPEMSDSRPKHNITLDNFPPIAPMSPKAKKLTKATSSQRSFQYTNSHMIKQHSNVNFKFNRQEEGHGKISRTPSSNEGTSIFPISDYSAASNTKVNRCQRDNNTETISNNDKQQLSSFMCQRYCDISVERSNDIAGQAIVSHNIQVLPNSTLNFTETEKEPLEPNLKNKRGDLSSQHLPLSDAKPLKKDMDATNKQSNSVSEVSGTCSPTTPIFKESRFAVADSMVRSCSVGYLDLADAQLVPGEMALQALQKDMPKRLVLVSNKTKNRKQSRHNGRHCSVGIERNCRNKSTKLKTCVKSRSLDSSDLLPLTESSDNKAKVVIEHTIPEDGKTLAEGTMQAGTSIQRKTETASTNIEMNDRIYKKRVVNAKHALSEISTSSDLDNLITHDGDDCTKLHPTLDRKLPRSSPSSPTPSKRGKRPQSASPIRRGILSSPFLGRKSKKNKNIDCSEDEASPSEEIFSSRNYKDLETFQKAQLRQKLKRGKIEPNGIGCNTHTTYQRREFVMHNKTPMWNENSQVYQLDFGGRVTQESAKNFQIEFRGKQVMQFGRIDGNAYTLDFQYPFSALQAFAVALANVTQRLK